MTDQLLGNLKVFIPDSVIRACVTEADEKYEMETGGTFMGWWQDEKTAVITTMIGPGPNALHESYHFQPDQDWQLSEIAKHYQASGRRETYIGDWHSHPNAQNGSLSAYDLAVLRRIIKTPRARCPVPIMAILAGYPNDWSLFTWRAEMVRRRVFWDRLVVQPMEPVKS